MAELFDGQDNRIFDASTSHIGIRGDVIIPINDTDMFIALSPLEAKELVNSLLSTLEEYKKQLSEAS